MTGDQIFLIELGVKPTGMSDEEYQKAKEKLDELFKVDPDHANKLFEDMYRDEQ